MAATSSARSAADRMGRPGPFQPRHRIVVVHGHNEPIGFRGRALQISHVPDMQQIEAAIRKRDRPPRGADRRDESHQSEFAAHLAP